MISALVRRPSRTGERGSVSVEVAILAPVFLALLAVAGIAGRTALAHEAIDAAAHDAARAASISRTATDARSAARSAVQDRLDWDNLSCRTAPTLTFAGTVDGRATSLEDAFRSPVGTPATVSVAVSCVVSFQSLPLAALPGAPDRKRVSARFDSPLDRYRSRSVG